MLKQSDFKQEYFEKGIKLMKTFFEKYPNGTLSTSWGQGKWWLFKQNDHYEFHYSGDWLNRDSCSEHCSFVSLDNCCESIKKLVEYNIWNQYIGKGEPGWSLRWLSAIESACRKQNVIL